MSVLSPRRLVSSVVLGVVLLVTGCANPLWDQDHYVVEGALTGTTCRATIDGRPFVGLAAALGDSIQILRDYARNMGLPEGQGLKTLICRGLILGFVSPEGTFPAPGRYRIAVGVRNLDTGSVNLSIESSHINEGRWPFAFTGVHLEGKEGYLQLDEMTESSARGTFHAIMRRQPNGE